MPPNVLPLPQDPPPLQFEKQRAGITLSHRGGFPSAPLGLIPSEVLQQHGTPGSRVSQIFRLNLALADGPARYFHDMAENVRETAAQDKAAGIHDQDATRVLPDVKARISNLKMQEQAVEKLGVDVANQLLDHSRERLALSPYDYSKHNMVDEMRDQQLRQHYRSVEKLVEKDRLKQRDAYARAILNAEPELSGMNEAEHQAVRTLKLMEKFPEHVARLDAEELALGMAQQTLSTVKRALSEERAALGAVAPLEPMRPPANRRWK